MTQPRPITDREIEDVRTLTFDEFLDKHSCGSSFWRRVKEAAARQQTGRLSDLLPVAPRLPEPAAYAIPREVHIDEPVLVAGDWHIPFHDLYVVDALLAIAERDGITHLVMNGDVMSQDVFLHGGFDRNPDMPPFEDEMYETERVFGVLSEVFTSITVVPRSGSSITRPHTTPSITPKGMRP